MPNNDSKLALGLIVEGDGEFHAFPSLISRVKQQQLGKLPIVNANGYGNITCRTQLHRRLNSLLSLNCIDKIIICIDALDPIRDGLVANCIDLKALIIGHVTDWLEHAQENTNIQFIPNISVVIQVQKLETWMLSDTDSLINQSLIKDCATITDADAIPNPVSKLKEIEINHIDTKNPSIAKRIFGCLNVEVMRNHSRSFNKFYREVS